MASLESTFFWGRDSLWQDKGWIKPFPDTGLNPAASHRAGDSKFTSSFQSCDPVPELQWDKSWCLCWTLDRQSWITPQLKSNLTLIQRDMPANSAHHPWCFPGTPWRSPQHSLILQLSFHADISGIIFPLKMLGGYTPMTWIDQKNPPKTPPSCPQTQPCWQMVSKTHAHKHSCSRIIMRPPYAKNRARKDTSRAHLSWPGKAPGVKWVVKKSPAIPWPWHKPHPC